MPFLVLSASPPNNLAAMDYHSANGHLLLLQGQVGLF
jgi:hypothetical protein